MYINPERSKSAMAATSPKVPKRHRLTVVSTMHYVRLVYRSLLFVLLTMPLLPAIFRFISSSFFVTAIFLVPLYSACSCL